MIKKFRKILKRTLLMLSIIISALVAIILFPQLVFANKMKYKNFESKATDIWILQEEGGCEAPNYYNKGRLMIEYLMDIKHMSYDQILKDPVSETAIFKEMTKWKDSTKMVIDSVPRNTAASH